MSEAITKRSMEYIKTELTNMEHRAHFQKKQLNCRLSEKEICSLCQEFAPGGESFSSSSKFLTLRGES